MNDEFVLELIRVFRVPKYPIWFEIRCEVDKPMIVKCEYYPEIDNIETIITEYELEVKK